MKEDQDRKTRMQQKIGYNQWLTQWPQVTEDSMKQGIQFSVLSGRAPDEIPDCPECDDTGKCQNCAGTGIYDIHSLSCKICGGTGECVGCYDIEDEDS